MSWARVVVIGLVVALLAGVGWWVWGRGPDSIDPTSTTSGLPGTVLLIPGHGGSQASMEALAQALSEDGWATRIVDIGDGSGDIPAYARQVTALARQYADQGEPVALVGYSMGGLIARAAVANGAASTVMRVVTIGTPHDGTSLAGVGALVNSPDCDTACRQMAPGSEFLDSLPVAGDASRWLAIYSETDDVIRPADSAALAGATVARVQDYCPASTDTHGDVVVDPFTLRAVTDFLDTGVVRAGCP